MYFCYSCDNVNINNLGISNILLVNISNYDITNRVIFLNTLTC